jgi:hypothetical protein
VQLMFFDVGECVSARPVSSFHPLLDLKKRSFALISLQRKSGQFKLFGPILNVVLMALDGPPVFIRSKALLALGQIVTSDPNILSVSTRLTTSLVFLMKRRRMYGRG